MKNRMTSLLPTPLTLMLSGILLLTACTQKPAEDIWVLDCKDEASRGCGYIDQQGRTMIDYGKYPMCFTDTFKHYAIVAAPIEGVVGINKSEDVLYEVFIYDNGPDYPSDGYFRIVQDEKIGYADVQTGEIKIDPAYPAARPFQNNYAAVCPTCEEVKDGEYTSWVNGKWGLIDKGGKMVLAAEYDNISEISPQGEALVIVEGEEKWIKIK